MGVIPGDEDGDETTQPVEVSWVEFDIVCGCTLSNSSYSPSLAPDTSSTPEPTAIGIDIPTPSPVSAQYPFQCGIVEDEFQVISTEVDVINGECFIVAPGTSANDLIIYTPDGRRAIERFAVFPLRDEDSDDVSVGYMLL